MYDKIKKHYKQSMLKSKEHLKNNSGDIYIQMIVCLLAIIVIFAFSFNVVTVISQKSWLDDRLNDVTRIVAVNGDINTNENGTDPVTPILEEIIDHFGGGAFTFTTDKWVVDRDDGRVQLDGIVEINYRFDDYPALEILNIIIPIDINITKRAISEVYYKT